MPYSEDDSDEILDEDLGIDFSRDSEILELKKKYASELDMNISFSNVIIIDGLPIIPLDKIDKLQRVIYKLFTQAGEVQEDWIFMPVNQETHMTKGYAFVQYASHEFAKIAIQKMDGLPLDKNHTFKVNLFDDFERLSKIPEEYTPPSAIPHDDKINLWSWLVDPKSIVGCDQFVLRVADETALYWNDPHDSRAQEPFLKRKQWTESYVQWSPFGTYLATLHTQGVIVWGGEGFNKLMRFQHHQVKLAEFSPNEKYLITFAPAVMENDNPKDPQCIIVWDVKTGKKLRGFLAPQDSQWPMFKWSSQDEYIACMDKDKGLIKIYQTPTMNLLENKSIKIPGLQEFAWSPMDNIISYWTPESGNIPARVSLMSIPSRKELRSKNLFNVSDCKLHWQNRGDYLCVKVGRQRKKVTSTNFELFRMREKDIPIEVLEMKDQILAFSWEPEGSRFAVIHNSGTVQKPDISFYELKSKSVVCLGTLEKRPANHLFWSPIGRYIVLAGLRNYHGALEFFDAKDMVSLRVDEHGMTTDVDWDPTGRFVTTSVSAWRSQLENGYNIWTFQGKIQHKVPRDRFYQFLWRPRPKSLLPIEKQKEIISNLSKYSKHYNVLDMKQRDAVKDEMKKRRIELCDSFRNYLREKAIEYKAQKKARLQLNPKFDSDDESKYQIEYEEISELFHTQEIVLSA